MDEAMPQSVPVCPAILNQDVVEIARLEQAAQNAWAVLYRRFVGDGSLSELQIDHLFARFVLGLTAVFYRTALASDHLAVFRHLVGTSIGATRTEAALRTSPPDFPPSWTMETIASVERLGRAEGLHLQGSSISDEETPGFQSAVGPQQAASGYASAIDINHQPSQEANDV